jgi:Flp pilus assembly protein TadG
MRRLDGRRLSLRARRDDARRDTGAAALEFALVLPVLVLILFGIIDYGLYFSNTLDAESGVQTAARQAIVGTLTPCATPLTDAGSASPQVQDVMCMVKNNTGSITGTSYVKVEFPADPTNPNPPNPPGWYPGQELIVCEVIDVQGLTGYVPLPRHAGQVAIRTKVVTQLETVTTTQQADPGGEEDTPPGGWDWCS